MIAYLIRRLRMRFGLRAQRWPMAIPRTPYGPHAPFTTVQRDDGAHYIEPRRAR